MVGIAKRPAAIPPELAERWARPWTRRRALRSMDLLAPWRLRSVAARLGGIGAPALVLWGERDDVFPPRNADPIVAALPGAELRIVPSAGHWAMLDAPEVVARHLAEFLRRESKEHVA
jgi:pimeloyl-ACP methyl ester carboxylesterase